MENKLQNYEVVIEVKVIKSKRFKAVNDEDAKIIADNLIDKITLDDNQDDHEREIVDIFRTDPNTNQIYSIYDEEVIHG
jgi:hypothetical protein